MKPILPTLAVALTTLVSSAMSEELSSFTDDLGRNVNYAADAHAKLAVGGHKYR